MTIWFASGNAHKKKELAAILNTHGGGNYNLLIPADAGLDFDPEETETTFHGNALLKARALYSLLEQRRPPLFKNGDPVIADDSGICVDALNGRPGIYSARYAGKAQITNNNEQLTKNKEQRSINNEQLTMGKESQESEIMIVSGKKLEAGERNALLLDELGDNPLRTARFVCAMALLFNPNCFFLTQETLEGEIVKSLECAKGSGGFGYDPILFIPSLGRTVAELSEDEKNTVSHRAKAGKITAAMLRAYF
jgi:XTP/dITP diphosphohydrolase